jgi:hypothetical protein
VNSVGRFPGWFADVKLQGFKTGGV